MQLLEECHELLAHKEIVICWIPSHIGIQGNEMVDQQAKNIAFIRINFHYPILSNLSITPTQCLCC